VWAAYFLAMLRPDVHVDAFDEDTGFVTKARSTRDEYLGLKNLMFRTSSFDNMGKNANWVHNVVIYIPKLHTTRPSTAAYGSRLNSVLNCCRMVPEGGTFIMGAALASTSITKQPIAPQVLNQLYAGYNKHGIFTRHIGIEIAALKGKTLLELLQFLLTHAGMGYQQLVCDSKCVPPNVDGTLVSFAEGSQHLYQTDHVWHANYVMPLERFVAQIELLLTITSLTTSTCERLRSLWTTLFEFDHELMKLLNASGLIVAKKP
jgi:hypothetical protein